MELYSENGEDIGCCGGHNCPSSQWHDKELEKLISLRITKARNDLMGEMMNRLRVERKYCAENWDKQYAVKSLDDLIERMKTWYEPQPTLVRPAE